MNFFPTSCLVLFPFLVVDIPGEDGASPLHYAARFRANLARPSASRQVSQAGSDGVDGDIEGVVAPLTNALSAASFGVHVNNVASQV